MSRVRTGFAGRARIRLVAASSVLLVLTGASTAVGSPGAAQPGTVTFVHPDDPRISYTEYVKADIDHERARFTRPGPANGAFRASPGTRVNFSADATVVWMMVNYRPDNCRSPGCGHFSLEVDGVLRLHGLGSDVAQGQRAYRVFDQAEPRPHGFSLIFPYGPAVHFDGLALAGGALLPDPPSRPGFLYVGYGDSITQGASSKGIVRTYPDQVARRKSWSVINMGFGGAWVAPIDGTAVGQIGGDLVTAAIGINDYNLSLPLDGTRRRYEGFLDALRAEQPTVPLYCITPVWGTSEGDPNAEGAVPDEYRQVIRDVVTRRMRTDPNLHLIEGLDLVPHSTEFFADGLHPNDRGFFLYARELSALLPH